MTNVLQPLMLRNRANSFDGDENQVVSEVWLVILLSKESRSFNLEDYIMDSLPQK